MWILTQNKRRILMTDGVDEICVAPPIAEGKEDFAVMMYRKKDGKGFSLGFYKTWEKASEILEQIIDVQSIYISCEGGAENSNNLSGNVIVPPKTYKMPPDIQITY